MFQGRSNHPSQWFPSEVTSIDHNQGPNTVQLMLQSFGLKVQIWLERLGMGRSKAWVIISHSTQNPRKAEKQSAPSPKNTFKSCFVFGRLLFPVKWGKQNGLCQMLSKYLSFPFCQLTLACLISFN